MVGLSTCERVSVYLIMWSPCHLLNPFPVNHIFSTLAPAQDPAPDVPPPPLPPAQEADTFQNQPGPVDEPVAPPPPPPPTNAIAEAYSIDDYRKDLAMMQPLPVSIDTGGPSSSQLDVEAML